MLATLAGLLALVVGLAVLLLPLITPELSRPRDAAWGALVLLLGLVLVTCADRLTGAPMLGVLCGGLLVGRLGSEVGQGRWRALSTEERVRLGSAERWQTGADQLLTSLSRGVAGAVAAGSSLVSWLQERRRPPSSGKRWIRPEATGEATEEAPAATGEETGMETGAAPMDASAAATPEQPRTTLEVTSFAEIETLLQTPALPADDGAADGAADVLEPEVIDTPDDDAR
jgi:hypothetical protein